MKLREEHFTELTEKTTVNSNQSCGWCGYEYKNTDRVYECNPHHRESLEICEKCYDGLSK